MKTNEESLNILNEKNRIALKGASPARTLKHKAGDRFTARERIQALFDPGSFVEFDRFVVHSCSDFGMSSKRPLGDGVITGYGRIHGQLVFAYSQDFCTIGGSMSRTQANKICKIYDLALENGSPVIGLNDSGGARIQEGVASLAGYGDIFSKNVKASGVIPQICAIMGPCAGGAVYSPALQDFIFMVEKTSYMFVTGPDVIKTVTGEEINKEDLGGGYVHSKVSGVSQVLCSSEKACILQIRDLVKVLPANNMDLKKVSMTAISDSDLLTPSLRTLIPDDNKKPYDMKEIITTITDEASFFEISSHFAPNIITGFAYISGNFVGIVANQPKALAGCLDSSASRKGARFVRFCNAFNIPIISLVDVPGFLPGVNQEHEGLISHGAKLLYAYAEATVPKITLITRKAYGGAYIVMASKHLGADVNLAYPNAEISVMGAEGAVSILYRDKIKDQPESKDRFIEEFENKFSNPYLAAELGYIDEVIDPQDTQVRIVQSLLLLKNKTKSTTSKKHGNIPM